MEEDAQKSDELTAFAPFEAIKDSKLSFKGSTKQPGQIEISDSEAFGFPKVLFRRSRTPTPAGTGEIQRNSNPVSIKAVQQGEKRETRVRIKPESNGTISSSRPPPPRAVSLQQPRAQVTKSLVLKRIGNLERNQDPANDLKKYWMPDSACKECSECQTKFNLLIRRHHCRICGRIFCNACCSQTIPGVLLRPDLQGNLRVCIECLDIFQEFHTSKGRMEQAGLNSSSQPGGEVSHAPRSVLAAPTKSQLEPPQATFLLQESYSRSPRPISWDDATSIRSPEVEMSPSRMNLEFDNPTPLRSLSSSSVRRQSKASLQPVTSKKDERLLALGEDEVEFTIHEVWFNMMNPITGLQPQNHRYRLRNYPRSYAAHDIVEWLIMQGHSRSRENAVCIGQALVDTKRLKIVSSIDEEFRDESNLFLELGEMASLQPSSSSPMVTDAPKWFQRLPEDGDSEYEVSDRLDSSSMQGLRYTKSSRNNAVSTFHKSQNVQEPAITISSVSELTGGISGSKKRKSPVVLSEPEDDYLVIKKDSKYEEKDVLSQGGSRESSVSRGDDGSEWGPFLSPSAVKSSQVSGGSFSVIDRQEVLEALPVTGLSTATEAAKEFTTESGKGMKSNEEARAVFERDHDNHFDALIIQLMQSFGLSLSWLSIIKPLITEATSKVKTNIFVNDQMDINQYVKVKKIPGGQKKNSSLVFGAVCSKNVTHKKMSHSIRNPTILLLKCAFEFQRKENQLSDFETIQLQEEKYLKNVVARVDTFKPSIILVQKSVSRLALEMLYELGIVVAVNVKPSVMARVARSTQGDLLHSLDQLFFDVRLGTCGHFCVKNFSLPDGVKKTLMYFDQCDATLGCVITLQGDTKRELKKVKKVTCFGLYISRNSKLETSFLVDEFAWPPSLQPRFLQNTEDYTSTSSTPEWPLYPSLAFPISSISPNELAMKLAVLAPDSDENTPADNEDPPAEQSSDPSGSQVQLDIPNRKKHLEPMLEEEKPQAGMPSQLQPLEASAAVEMQDDHSPKLVVNRTDSVLVRHTIPTVSNEVLSHLGEKEFQLAFEKQLLSISPSIAFPTPYLHASQGIAADVRQYLPRVIYWSYQFKVKPPSRDQPDALTSQMEMGLTKSTLQKTVELESLPSHELSEETQSQPRFTHSYRSVSDHPFTTSVFILKANMNEMKAALADYRARAGLPEKADCFFFPSARKASDYRLHLQNLFNKYKQFEAEDDSVDSASEDLAENEIQVPQKMKNEGAVKLKRRIQRWKAPEGSSSSASQSDHSEEFHQTSRSNSEKSKDINGKSTSESYRSSVEAPKVSKRRSMEPITESFTDDSLKKSRSSKFGSPRLSETFGTFEDLDHEHPQVAGGDEEEDIDTDVTDKWMYEGWMVPYQQVDCLNPINHQGIAILFSSTCHDGQKHQQPCVPPCIIPMDYYGTNDISLGDFLRRYCFRPQYRCQTCGVDMNKHQRHVIHGNSALHIQMQQLQAAIPGSNEEIYTWLACRHCAQCTPYTQMSEDSLLFSFAKFLELRFYGGSYVTRYHSDGTSDCPHLIHKDYIQHFCCKNSIASFQPSPISLLEVCIPPKTILISTPHAEYHHDYGSEIKHIQRIIEGVFYRIRQKLQQYNMEPVTATIKDYVAGAKAERVTFRNKLKLLKDLVVKEGFVQSGVSMETSQPEGKDQESEDSLDSLQDGIVDLKRKLTEVVECWNINLENTDAAVRAYRSKKDTIMTDGHSPHETPLPTTDGEGASSGSLVITPKEASISSPGLLHTPNLSPDLSRVTSQNTSSSHSDSSYSTAPVHTQATLLQKPRSHSRNLSDSNIPTPAEAAPELKLPTKHKRQLSDSFCAKSSTTTSNSSATRGEEGDGESKKQPEGEQTATSSPPEDQPSEDTESKDSQSDNLSFTSEGDEGRARDRTEYQRIKTMFSYYNQPLRGDPSDRRSPHLQPGAQGDDTSHTDSSGGIFAKLRGKDADGRDDPTKYYLLDPSEFNSSPHLGAHPAPLELPNPRPHRRPGTVPRKTVVPVATSTAEASGDGKSGERKVVRERTGVLSRPFQKLPPPFDLNEHHNMHGHVSIPVAIYEKEATSIIAYALSSHKYVQELKAMQEKKQNASAPLDPTPPSPKLYAQNLAHAHYRKPVSEPEKPQSSTSGSSKGSSLMAALKKKGSAISLFSGLSFSTMLSDPLDPTPDKSSEDHRRHDTGGSVKGREASQFGLPEDELDGKWNTAGSDSASSAGSKHISLEFTTPDKSASFFCKVYFAEEFHRLRQLIFPSGEVRFVRSLARCVKYDAKGGKSRSMFCKVADDRFILKQIKSVEISSFEQFAPQYFEHVNRALEEGRPLVLAKILGAYSIGYRNTKTGNSKRQDVIIMENLLYGHKSAKVFDLKGSMRSRYIDPSKDSSGDVLLDENYLNYIYSCPVYVYPHSKCVLMQAICADSEFLAQNSIMDYSLLTCIDETSGELVVGIIDYVRTFTLDKRLEMYLKKTAGRVLPTVVWPELYRKRFCAAMERYFTVVPDKWTGFGPSDQCEALDKAG